MRHPAPVPAYFDQPPEPLGDSFELDMTPLDEARGLVADLPALRARLTARKHQVKAAIGAAEKAHLAEASDYLAGFDPDDDAPSDHRGEQMQLLLPVH